MASRAKRRAASAEKGRRRRPARRPGSRKVSRASASETTSAGSVPSTAAASRRSRSSSAARRLGYEQPGAAAEQRQVARADPPAGAGEQPDQGGVGGRVLQHLAGGDQVGDLGQVQQPGQADHLDRHVPGDQRGVDVGEVRGRYGTARRSRRARAGAHQVGDGVGEPGDLLGVGGQQGAAHEAVALGARRGAQRLDACVHGAQRVGEGVGEVEQAAAAAAVLAERVAGGGGAVGVREVRGKSSRLATEAPRQP